MSDPILDTLQTATDGLLYTSETDAPFAPVLWPDAPSPLTDSYVLALSGHPPDSRVEQVPPDAFFADLITDQDWFGPLEKQTAARYRALRDLLDRHLSELRIYRVGRTNIDIYLVGKTPCGSWLGLKTSAVET